MSKQPTSDIDYNKPVAYDAEGRPLYAHPPMSQSDMPPVVQVVRQATPSKPYISDELKQKHEDSQKKFPDLNLSEGEYVIATVRRHQIGLFWHYAIGIMLVLAAVFAISNYQEIANLLQISNSQSAEYIIIAPLVLFIMFVSMMIYANYYIYNSNRFYLTNESVIQQNQLSLFSRNEQTISLSNIEDASYSQTDIISQLFNYGSIRLSTEGDETTYRFSFVTNPRHYLNVLNDAIEAFKNGRPVDPDEN